MALRQKFYFRGIDGELVRPRAKQMAFHADDIADVQELIHAKVALGQRILLDVDLNLRAAVGQHQEIGLAEAADAQNAAAGNGVDAVLFELRPGLPAVRANQVADRGISLEPMRVGIDTQLRELGQMRAALQDLFFFG